MSTAETITASPAPKCRRTNPQFGSILTKWKAMDRQQSQRKMYADPTCLVSMTKHTSNPRAPRCCGNPSQRFGGSPSQRFGPNPSQRFGGNKKSSYARPMRGNQKKPSVRIFQSKRFSKEINNSESFNTAATMEMSDSCSAEDPCEMITFQENQASTLSAIQSDMFEEHYTLGNQLGVGAFAVVKVAHHKATKQEYAVKIVSTAKLSADELDALKTEMGIMAQLQHPNLVGLHEIYKATDEYNIVMEYIRGGELLDRIVQKEFYTEKEARNVCQSLFHAMAYCHEKRVAHRDLKPENLLLISEHDDARIKIADFGFAKLCPQGGYVTMCGSPSYVAPEILTYQETGPYNVQCDMWSLGVIAYILLGGYTPFGDDELTLSRNIKAGKFEFHPQYWEPVSDDAKNFISGLLTVNPKKRLTAEQALGHDWMNLDDTELASKDLSGSLESLKRFNGKRKFRAAVNTLIATQRITSILEDHR